MKKEEKEKDNSSLRRVAIRYPAVVHCPTKQDWIKVVKKALEYGCRWLDDEEKINEELWYKYKEESCIILEGMRIGHSPRVFFEKQYPKFPIISVREYLGG